MRKCGKIKDDSTKHITENKLVFLMDSILDKVKLTKENREMNNKTWE